MKNSILKLRLDIRKIKMVDHFQKILKQHLEFNLW